MAFLAKLRPMGPWRAGSDTGERSRAGALLHSDSLYSALTHALAQMDLLEPWLEATAANPQGSSVRFSSCFPFVDQLLLVAPPRTLWPLPPSLKVRWKSARFVPTSMVSLLINNRKVREDDWMVDGPSECLLPVVRGGQSVASPFRPAVRTSAAVDRLGEGVVPYRTACVEFHKTAGLWVAFDFVNENASRQWTPAIQGALKLLADTGLGGQRSRGWGRFEQPEFIGGRLPQLLFGRHAPVAPADSTAYWLLSQFSPSEADIVDWRQGSYEIALRNGRVESISAGFGAIKKSSKQVIEGSVLVAEKPLAGTAHNVAPEGFEHPVYRAGFALALPLPTAKKVETVVEESSVADTPAEFEVPTATVLEEAPEELPVAEVEPIEAAIIEVPAPPVVAAMEEMKANLPPPELHPDPLPEPEAQLTKEPAPEPEAEPQQEAAAEPQPEVTVISEAVEALLAATPDEDKPEEEKKQDQEAPPSEL